MTSLVFLMVLGITMGTAQAAPVTAVALPAPKPLQIDGDLSDWAFAKANAIVLDSKAQLTPGVGSTVSWTGRKDLSSTVYVAYDAQNLFLAFDVADDQIVQQFAGVHIYNGDGPELYLDTNPAAKSTTYNKNVWQFGFTPGTDAAKPEGVLHTQVSGRSITAKDMEIAAKRTAEGYAMEIRLSLAALDFQPKAGDVVGFDVAVNDVDSLTGKETESQIILGGSGDGWQSPAVFARLVFW
jgi:hypothetical protein